MKAALKYAKTYIIALVLAVIGIGIPMLITGITIWSAGSNPFSGYAYVIGIMTIAYFLIGFIWGDVITGRWRKEKKDWDGPVPENIKLRVWKTRWPLYLAAIACLVAFLVLVIYEWATGAYPFLDIIALFVH